MLGFVPEVGHVSVWAASLLVLAFLLEEVAVAAVVRLRVRVRSIRATPSSAHVTCAACTADAVVAVRTVGVLPVASSASASRFTGVVLTRVVRLFGGVRAVSTLPASVHMTPDEMRHTIRVMERGLAYYATRMAKNFENAFPGATIKLPAGAAAALSDSSDSEGEGEKKKKKKKKKKAAATKMDVDQPPT